MLFKEDDEIRQDGISVDDLDDEALDKAIKGEKVEEDEETPDDSLTSNNIKDEKKEPSQGGEDTPDEKNIPFHKHPRFKEVIEKTHLLTEELEKANKVIEELKSTKKVDEEEPMAGWFKELYGDSEEVKTAWKIYNSQSKRDKEETKREIIAELESRNNLIKQEESKYNDWVTNEVVRLQDEGEKFDKNKLLKIMADYRPATEDGRSLDFNKGIELYKKIYNEDDNKDKNKIRKQIADNTVNDTKANKSDNKPLTSKDLRHKSFLSLIQDEE